MLEKEIDGLADVRKRLDVLIAISLKKELKEDKSMTMRDMIALLDNLGLKYTDIAGIFGKSSSYIASELTQIRKQKSKGGVKSE